MTKCYSLLMFVCCACPAGVAVGPNLMQWVEGLQRLINLLTIVVVCYTPVLQVLLLDPT